MKKGKSNFFLIAPFAFGAAFQYGLVSCPIDR